MVLLDHYNVHRLGIFESQEAEAARPTGGPISHDSALHHFAKLGEVVSQRL